ncbi:ZNF76 isoform 11, partial [Pan troglodytes]
LTIPSPDADLATSGTHTVTMVSADGTQTQPVTIITSGAVVAEDSSVASLRHQQVALLATANGTHIAVQVSRDLGGKGIPRPEKSTRNKGELDEDLEEKGI